MKNKKFLAIVLLSLSFCFVSGVGYGEILGKYSYRETTWKEKEMAMQIQLLEVSICYIMRNPTSFLDVKFYYDMEGAFSVLFPRAVDTKEKLWVDVLDNRGVFSGKFGAALLDEVKKQLAALFLPLGLVATDIDNDVVAVVGVILPGAKIRTDLAYFYQGEYHLWSE